MLVVASAPIAGSSSPSASNHDAHVTRWRMDSVFYIPKTLLEPGHAEHSISNVANQALVGLRLRPRDFSHTFLARGRIQSFLDPPSGCATHRPGRKGFAAGNGKRDEKGQNPSSLSSSSSSPSASNHDAHVIESDPPRLVFIPYWAWTNARTCDRLRVLLHPCRPW